MLRSKGQNQKWPTGGPGGYITPAISGSQCFRVGGGGGWNQKWPTSGPSGYTTPAV